MDYERNEGRRRRELEKALAAKKKLEARFAELTRKARTAKSRLLATTRQESWYRHALAWLDRDAGYDGEMASARVWLRSLPIHDYIAALAPYAEAMPDASNIQVEVATVRANQTEWTKSGDALLLDRARRDYVTELGSFRAWQRDNPDKKDWRPARRRAPSCSSSVATRYALASTSRSTWIAAARTIGSRRMVATCASRRTGRPPTSRTRRSRHPARRP